MNRESVLLQNMYRGSGIVSDLTAREIFQNAKKTQIPISEKAKKIFQSVDVDGSGHIDAIELRRLLKNWKITGIDHNSLVDMFMKDTLQMRKTRSLNLPEFNAFMSFFFCIKDSFDRYPKANHLSITLSELSGFLESHKYNFNKDVLTKFLELFDYDHSGLLEFNEILGLFLYLNRLEKYYNTEDSDGSNSLDERELQSLLRSLKIHVTIEEMKLLTSTLPPGKLEYLDFDNFVDLLFYIRQQLPHIKSKAANNRKVGKIKAATRSAEIMSEDNKQSLDKTVQEEKTKLEAILAECKRTKTKWQDPEFPADSRSLFPDDPQRSKVIDKWLRPESIAAKPRLFVDGVDEGDVVQGRLGNCYLLSAFCVLACAGCDQIQKLFVAQYPEYGVYQCRFYKNRRWYVVTVDDQIPVDKDNLIFFSQCRDQDEFWVQILEKAYAKLHGNYAAIEHGYIADALVDMTGECSEVFTELEDTNILWDKMIHFMQEGYLMGCSCETDSGNPNEPTPMGLLNNHAYGILDIQEVYGHKLLRLRNPWGSYEWTGAWSDGSCEWTDEIKNHFNFEFADDGTFFMEFYDFCENFTHFISLRLLGRKWSKQYFNGEWKPELDGGCLNHPTWMKNPQFKLHCDTPRTVFISCLLDDGRFATQRPYTYKSAGITVIRRKDNNLTLHETLESRSEVAAVSKFICTREASLSFEAEADQPYTVIISTFEPSVHTKWYLVVAVLGPGSVEVIPQQQRLPSTSVKGVWSGELAAGCTDWNTWRDGTQYYLLVREAGEKKITIVQARKKEQMPQIGFYVFPMNPEKLPAVEKDKAIYSCKFLDSATVTGSFNFTRGIYTILPCTYRPHFENSYGLVVQGEGCELKPIPTNWYKQVVNSSWTDTLCGGCGNNNNKDYVKNPIIHFRVESEKLTANIILQIDQYSEIKGIGFYIFESDSSGELIRRMDRSDFKTDTEVSKRFELPQGDYVLLPVTYTKGLKGPFTLLTFTDEEILLRQLNKS